MVAVMMEPPRASKRPGTDRRLFPRKEVQMTVEGRRLDHSIPARRDPQLSLELNDLSVGGLSGATRTPIGPGERVAVFFPPSLGRRGWDAYGRVIRVEPGHFGYRVAVEFEAIPAAA